MTRMRRQLIGAVGLGVGLATVPTGRAAAIPSGGGESDCDEVIASASAIKAAIGGASAAKAAATLIPEYTVPADFCDVLGFAGGVLVGAGCEALIGPETGGLGTAACVVLGGGVEEAVNRNCKNAK